MSHSLLLVIPLVDKNSKTKCTMCTRIISCNKKKTFNIQKRFPRFFLLLVKIHLGTQTSRIYEENKLNKFELTGLLESESQWLV